MSHALKILACGLLVGVFLLPVALVARAAEDAPGSPSAKPASKAKTGAGSGKADSKENAKPSASGKVLDDKALDDALLNDLDNELLEGAGNLRGAKTPAAKQTAPTKSTSPTKTAGERDKPAGSKGLDPRDLLDDDAPEKKPDDQSTPEDAPAKGADGEDLGEPSPEQDPLAYISQEMRQVEHLIPEHARRAHAQQLQERITEDLTKLIEQAENQAAAQQGQKAAKTEQKSERQSAKQPKNGKPGKDSNQPANDSTERMGKSEQARPDPVARQGLLKQAWGHLPERTRDQMLQNPPERFLPQYELMIERYYRRLAEERNSK